jgi:NADH-quinone oxidoreductase subunit I
MLCSTYCPAQCIHIVAADDSDKDVEKAPVSFEIEMLRCVFCGFCEEACPVDAIRLTNEYEMSGHAEQEWVADHHELAFRKSLNGGKGIQSTVDDKDRMKLRL